MASGRRWWQKNEFSLTPTTSAGASVTPWLETVRSASADYVGASAWFFPTTVDGLLVEVKGVLLDALKPTGFETVQAVSRALFEECPSVGFLGKASLCRYTSKLKKGLLRGPGEYRTPPNGWRRWVDQERQVFLAPRVQRLISSQRSSLVAALQRGLEQAQAAAAKMARCQGRRAPRRTRRRSRPSAKSRVRASRLSRASTSRRAWSSPQRSSSARR